MSWATSSPGMAISRKPEPAPDSAPDKKEDVPVEPSERKKVVVVGLGMVGIAFM